MVNFHIAIFPFMGRQPAAAERLPSQRQDPVVRRAEANEVEAKRRLDVVRHDCQEALKVARYESKKAKTVQAALDAATMETMENYGNFGVFCDCCDKDLYNFKHNPSSRTA